MAVAPTASSNLVSLYVGDLHPDVTDDVLRNAFSQFESVASVRVSRDSATARSLCYGYVNFISPQDAIDAIGAKTHTILNGQMIRVTWSHRDSNARKSGIGNVFVKNLSDSVSNAVLQDMFGRFGNILSCKVSMTEDGKSRCHGFVQFETESSAIAAIEKLNGLNIDGKQIFVGKFIKKSDRVMASIDTKFTNLYMKNLDPEIGEEHLQKKFSEFGKIASLVISKDDNGVSKGFGFINFDNPDDAKRAMEVMNGSQVGSKVLYVARAQKKTERQQILNRVFEEKRKDQILKYKGSNVYVKNINDDITHEDLVEHFSQCGTITSAKIMLNDKGISRGFGFICFASPEEASKAVNTLHGHMFHSKPLYVAIAQTKEERQTQMQHHFSQRVTGLVPAAYPPYYFPSPVSAVPVPPMPQRPGLIYQPLGLAPGWRPNNFASPSRPGFQPSPSLLIPNAPRQAMHNRGRLNGQMLFQNNVHAAPYKQYFQQTNQSVVPSNDSANQQAGNSKYVPNSHAHDGGSKTTGVGSEGSEVLSSKLAAASPEQQKQILGESLYPLVENHKVDLAGKITGMLLEMDNAELLLLLESPESLAAKVEEAVQVLEISKTKVSTQDSIHSPYFSSEVSVV